MADHRIGVFFWEVLKHEVVHAVHGVVEWKIWIGGLAAGAAGAHVVARLTGATSWGQRDVVGTAGRYERNQDGKLRAGHRSGHLEAVVLWAAPAAVGRPATIVGMHSESVGHRVRNFHIRTAGSAACLMCAGRND
eukprot:COSAG01_NODE_925_length_12707_cov_21.250297_5_plen_135_part_00